MAFFNDDRRGRDKESNSNHGARRDQSRSRSREKETDQEKENREREHNQTIMATHIADPDLSITFASTDQKESALVSGQTVQLVMPVRCTQRKCSTTLTLHFETDYKVIQKSLLDMEPGEYVHFQPASVDGMVFLVRYFPHGHDADPTAATRIRQSVHSSIGLSLSNKLDMIHRLRRGGKQAELKMKVFVKPKRQTLTFNLSELVTRNIVFKKLNFHFDTSSKTALARAIIIDLDMKHINAWQLHFPGDDEYRLKFYRSGLEFGDMEIYLIEGDMFEIYGCDDAPKNKENNNSNSSSSKKTEAEDQEREDGRPAVRWDFSIKVSKVSLMARFPYFETWIKKWHITKAIAVSAPSILYLNWIAFYAATGQLHDSTDAEWFVRMAHMMVDYGLLQCAIELCIQRLTKKNVLRTCELFQDLALAEGIAHLKKWITDNQGTLKRTKVEQRHGRQMHMDVLKACKKALIWH